MDAASTLDDDAHPPRPGDPALCLQCGAVNKFADNMSVVALAPGELETYPLELYEEIMKVRTAILTAAMTSKEW